MKKVVAISYNNPRPRRIVGDGEFELHLFDIGATIDHKDIFNVYHLDVRYRSGERTYHEMLRRFLAEHGDAEIVINNGLNAFHPEWAHDALGDKIKIWGSVDDPVSSYQMAASCAWAYDGAFYVSPSYAAGRSMAEVLGLWGIEHTHWFPLAGSFWSRAETNIDPTAEHRARVLGSMRKRTRPAIYIGNLNGPKLDRLALARRRLGDRLAIYGNWPLYGYAGYFGPLRKRGFLPYRVRGISDAEREAFYFDHKICLNLHMSERRETGNLRMYEAPSFGLLLVSDKAADDWHAKIFEPGVEAVFYDTIDEAAELIQRYLADDEARIRIATAGFERWCRDYDREKCLLDLLRWAATVPKKKTR